MAGLKEVRTMSSSNPTSRRNLLKKSFVAAAVLSSGLTKARGANPQSAIRNPQSTAPIHLGGPVFEKYQDPQGWVAALKKLGYSAAYCPVGVKASDAEVKAYEDAAQKAGIIIAETGAWSNPISPKDDGAQGRPGEVPPATGPGGPHRRPLLRQHRRLARRRSGTAPRPRTSRRRPST